MSSIEPNNPTRTETYAISITGELGEHWQAWFEGMTVEQPGDGTTVITGQVADQSALHGLLQRISDLGLPLDSVKRISAEDPTTRPAPIQPNEKGTQP